MTTYQTANAAAIASVPMAPGGRETTVTIVGTPRVTPKSTCDSSIHRRSGVLLRATSRSII